jgi:MFS family permease
MGKKFLPAYLLTFVNVLGFSIMMPVLPFIVKDYGAPEWVYGLLLTCYAGFQFIGAPYLGSLSDHVGRKPVLLISHGGTLLSWFVFIIALLLPEYPVLGLALPLWIIALSRILDGLTGGNTSVANAYIGDITTREEKGYIFGYLGGISGLGMIIGPGLGGLSSSTPLGYFGTLFVAVFISAVTLIIMFRYLKESHPQEHRSEKKKFSLWQSIYLPGRIRKVNPSPVIKVLFTVKMFFSTMISFYISSIALYLIDLFSFNEKELGTFFLVVGIFLAFNQAFVSKRFIKRFGEFNTLILGLALCVVGLFSITLTRSLWLFIPFYYLMNLGLSLCFPTFNSLISSHADRKMQGEVMGISEAIHSFAMAVFPVIAAYIYTQLGSNMYHFVSLLPLCALLMAILTRKRLSEHLSQ